MRRFLALISLMGAVVFGQVPVGTEINNVALASYEDANANGFVENSNMITTIVSGGYQLEITKSADATVVAPGERLTYTITVINSGNISPDAFTVKDTIRTGFQVISVSPSATINGQIVTWNMAELPGGQSRTLTLEVEADTELPADEVFTNTAWLTMGQTLAIPSNTVDVLIGSLSDLSIRKSVAEAVSAIGEIVHYTITVTNTGNTISTGTVVTDTLPAHVSFMEASHNGTLVDGNVVWNVEDLMAGDSASLSLDVIVNSSMPTNATVLNRVSVINVDGASAEASVYSVANPWLQTIEKWAAPGEYAFEDTVEFEIRMTNSSPDAVFAVTVRDTLPEPLQIVSASNNAVIEDDVVIWNLGTLNAGAEKVLHVVTTVGSLLEARPEVTNRAWIATANAGSNFSDHTISLAAFPELTLEKIAPETVQAGDSLVYRFIMGNTGNSMAHDVTLTDTLSNHLIFGSANRDYTYDESSHSVSWHIGELASQSQDSLELVLYIESPILDGTQVQNTAYLACVEGSVAQSTAMTQVISAPGLFLEISGDRHLMAGDTIAYTLEYANLGTEIATHVVLTDTLPAGIEFISATRNPSVDLPSRVITWNVENLSPGDTGSFHLTGRISDEINYITRLTNGGLLRCAQGAEAVAQHHLNVRAPVLDIELIGDTTYVLAGDVMQYDLSFANVGDTIATNVVVVDSLPDEVTFVNASSGAIYDAESHSITWYIGDLEPLSANQVLSGNPFSNRSGKTNRTLSETGEVQEFSIEVTINYPLPNGMELLNTAYIYSDMSLQAQAVWLSIVEAAPEFVFTKTADVEVFPGDTIHYSLDFSNQGTDHATGVAIVDTLDSRLEFISATGNYQYNASSHSLSWEVGDLRAGASSQLQVVTMVDGMLEDGAQVGNRAWLSSNELEPLAAAAITTNILPLSVVLDASPRSILGNGQSSSTLAAHVYSYLGNPVPDGIAVNFYTDAGTIPDSLFITETVDGIAFSTLVSDTVLFEAITATPYARAIYSDTDYAEDTTEVVFMIGAFDGTIVNYAGIPQENVRVELRRASTGAYAGHDSTDENGYYLIPIYQDALYQITYTLIGDDGTPYETVQEIVIQTPTEGQLVTNLNSVSGWIYDEITGQIIPEDSILVIVAGEQDSTETLGKIAGGSFRDSTYTDSTGKFFFTNLMPGAYQVEVVYNGMHSYSDGAIDVSLHMPGLYVVNANVTLRSSPFYLYKSVDVIEAAVGDTLHYTLNFGTQEGVTFPDSVFITDFLPHGLELIESSLVTDAATTWNGWDGISNEMKFSRSSIQVGDSLHIEFDARITLEAGLGWIENRALVASSIDSTWSNRNPLSRAKTKIIFPFLKVEKQSNRRVIEMGDVVTYTVKLTNTSNDDFVHDFVVEDVLPQGFKFRKNSSIWNGEKVTDPVQQEAVGKRIALSWTIGDTLEPGETFEMKYRIIAGLNAKEGTNTNEVMARGHTLLGFPVLSNLATADVILKPGLFSDRGLIIGKVYYDLNANTLHDHDEPTVKNVELIMENGARIRTDEYGKYSVPDVTEGMHVIRVNESTLPTLSEIILDSPNYLGDTQSKMVRVPAAGIAKANFALREIAQPGTITGTVYYDLNKNGVRDPEEETQAGAVLVLNDTTFATSDSSGRFIFMTTPLGDGVLTLDELSLPSFASLMPADSSLDSLAAAGIWHYTLFSGDSMNIDIPLKKHELFSVVSKEATLEMRTEMLTEEFRLLVYKPWSMLIRIGFVSGSATLQSEIFTELRNIGDLMKWQTQINLDINGHTDNVPLAAGGTYNSNMELSLARAQAIRNYLVSTMGISADRIRAFGHGDTLAMADNNTAEGRALNRRVEMVFFNAEEDDSEFNQLEFMYDIQYSGEVAVKDIRFHQELPPGFTYKEGSGKINKQTLEPVVHREESDIWEFGAWNAKTHSEFDMAMKPNDFEKVQGTGIVSSYLEMIDEDGNTILTDSLKTQISTLVEALSFYMVLEGTQFDVGSADLKPSAYPSLQKMGKFLAWQPDIEIVVEGFTDDRGSYEFNLLLSEWRATSVKNYLVENYNVNPDNIHTHGLGPHYPVGDNETWAGRAANRRVEVLVNAEVGEAALLELDLLKPSLKRTITVPVDPLNNASPDSALSVPAGQTSTLVLNMSYPAYVGADSMSISLVLPNDLEYVDVPGTLKSWSLSLEADAMEVNPRVAINAPEGVIGRRDLTMTIQLFEKEKAISSVIEKTLRINLEEPDVNDE